jgi:hypothetical protein
MVQRQKGLEPRLFHRICESGHRGNCRLGMARCSRRAQLGDRQVRFWRSTMEAGVSDGGRPWKMYPALGVLAGDFAESMMIDVYLRRQ